MANGIVDPIRLAIRNMAMSNDPYKKYSLPASLAALTDQGNVNQAIQIDSILQKTNGQYAPQARVTYRQRPTSASLTSFACSPTYTGQTLTEQVVSITRKLQRSFFVDEDYLLRIDSDYYQNASIGDVNNLSAPAIGVSKFLQDQLEAEIWKALSDAEVVSLGLIKAAYGRNAAYGSATAKNLTFYEVNNAISQQGMRKMTQDMKKNQEPRAPYIISAVGSLFDSWVLDSNYVAGMNANLAIDMTGVRRLLNYTYFGSAFEYASVFSESGNENHMTVMIPGAVQILNHSDYVMKEKVGSSDAPTYFQIAAPFLITPTSKPIIFDISGEYVKKCLDGTNYQSRGWQIDIRLAYDLYFLPSDLYTSSDPLYQVNNLFQYNAIKATS